MSPADTSGGRSRRSKNPVLLAGLGYFGDVQVVNGWGTGVAIPLLEDGRLPLGRWTATSREVEERFAGPNSGTVRQEIWTEWLRLTEALQDVVGSVPAAWLSGSFFTNKPEPGDVDSVYVVESSSVMAVLRAGGMKAQFLQAVASSRVRATFGLRVDSYVLEWVPTASPDRPVHAARYLSDRGYWDDLWSRERSTDLRKDAIPSRGYLEVILDGYV